MDDATQCNIEGHRYGDIVDAEGNPVCSRCGWVDFLFTPNPEEWIDPDPDPFEEPEDYDPGYDIRNRGIGLPRGTDCGWKVVPVASLDAERPGGKRGEGRKIPTPADYRRPEPDPLLRAWCDPDYAEQRKCLDWRSRVILYLRHVECWPQREVGEALGVCYARIQQLEDEAIRKLAAQRVRRSRERAAVGRAA